MRPVVTIPAVRRLGICRACGEPLQGEGSRRTCQTEGCDRKGLPVIDSGRLGLEVRVERGEDR